ncbi:WD40 repeat-like protein [Lophium mytilinum]|uniref:WD40 repeat-like protein n=1 Tax=Lophium mytilinum TaxID=390894 RepID=A0A6A6QH90_9PEZI|nr:WD40 repeat-like protein [Lophium mytilinum]
MSRSTDPGHFFQTTASIDEGTRKASKSKNKKGNPIKLTSKLLAIIPDLDNEGAVYVAEAAGVVRRIVLESKTTTPFTGPMAPLTSLCLSTTRSPRTLFAGCWDKTIWSWSTATRAPGRRFVGHTDFVKCVVCVSLGGRELLFSGAADATIIIWDVETGEALQTLKGHARGVLSLAVNSLSLADSLDNPSKTKSTESESVIVFSAGSDREIRRWTITATPSSDSTLKSTISVTSDPNDPHTPHETSINQLTFSPSGDLFTASSDKSAQILSRTQNFAPDTTFPHPDFVRAVAVDEGKGWVVTACRDEEVRVWDSGSGKCVIVLAGHYEEVTGVVIWGGKVVSVGIDGTVRSWELSQGEFERVRKEDDEEKEGVVKEEEKGKKSLMTVEEEAELAALMDESD